MKKKKKKKKIREALGKLNNLFDRAERDRKVKLKHVKVVIDTLKQREAKIKKHLENETQESKIQQLTSELEVINAQRQKGKVLLMEL